MRTSKGDVQFGVLLLEKKTHQLEISVLSDRRVPSYASGTPNGRLSLVEDAAAKASGLCIRLALTIS